MLRFIAAFKNYHKLTRMEIKDMEDIKSKSKFHFKNNRFRALWTYG